MTSPEKTSRTLTPETPVENIPSILITPLDWALESQRLAAEYTGLPEGKEFLVHARRFRVIAVEFERLQAKINSLEAENKMLDLALKSKGH